MHAVFPHIQNAALLGADPSAMAQFGKWLHLSWDSSQNLPVVPVHAAFPQMQVSELAADPSVMAQGGPVRVQIQL
tara:strand:- start:92 stop:316 length:225 start_codon:yes stop_codon:yes gene_type:complete